MNGTQGQYEILMVNALANVRGCFRAQEHIGRTDLCKFPNAYLHVRIRILECSIVFFDAHENYQCGDGRPSGIDAA